MVRAGKFNRRVVLQRPTPVQNVAGESVEEFTDVAEVWAQIVPRTSKEFFDSDKVTSQIDGFFKIRHRTDVGATWRVRMDDTATSPTTARFFGIITVNNPLDGRRELLLFYKEIQSGEPV